MFKHYFNKKKFILYRQLEEMDCGPACLQMVAATYGKRYGLEAIKVLCHTGRLGATLFDLSEAAKKIGFETLILKTSVKYLKEENPFPIILHWRQNHYVVLYHISPGNIFYIADPASGIVKISEEDFIEYWKQSSQKGVALLLVPSENFNEALPPVSEKRSLWFPQWTFFKSVLTLHRAKFISLAFLMLIGLAVSLLTPLTMKILFDSGVTMKNLNIVFKIILFQLLLFFGDITVQWIRGLVSVRLSTELSIDIIKQFLHKLVLLPIHFFDTKSHYDLLQRIEDQGKIDTFLTHKLVQTVFSVVLIVTLSIQLLLFNLTLFAVFTVLTILSLLWIFIFHKKQFYVNYKRFNLFTHNRNSLVELISGMTEVKINGAQQSKVAKWESIQEEIFRLDLSTLTLSQYQALGVSALTQLKNIGITFFCAYWVINDKMSLGLMLAIGYIVGQLNNPIVQLVDFFRSAQDARLAHSRMHQIQKKENEDNSAKLSPPDQISRGILLRDVSFRYDGSNTPNVLQNISLHIPIAKVTAIVGDSGSGKTTLMKLLLNFYNPKLGEIFLEDLNMKQLNSALWRAKCGVVMQDGYIFSASIAENIAMTESNPNYSLLEFAAKTACIYDFIQKLPQGFNTKIGRSGIELSGGQKQRILIARAIYRDPQFICFDEATSALDANNEKAILENLSNFFKGRTVVVIAHRLSTVKNADQIVVLKSGEIVEVGNHEQLTQNKSHYYELVRNQLELGG